MFLLINGEVCDVVWFQHHKPGKGGAIMKVKCKNVRTGQTVEKTFRANEKVTQAIIEKETKQFLYREGDMFVFMDTEDYTQMQVSCDILGVRKDYLIEGEDVELVMYEDEILDIELPAKIKMNVKEATPGVKGDTVSGATKKVKLETGLEIEVPLFINEGENVLVDTRTGKYISRAE